MTAPSRIQTTLFVVGILLVYLVLRLINLTSFPVFADEAIYIRWAQLILDDPGRYWLFSLNDGKTPLFIWTMVPFLDQIADQLLAARLVSVVVGFVQVLVLGALAWNSTKHRAASLWAMVLGTVLPFWYWYQKMALMDSLLTLWFSLAMLCILLMANQPRQQLTFFTASGIKLLFKLFRPAMLLTILMFGLTVFFALWTKLPAVLFFAPLFIFSWYTKQQSRSHSFFVASGVGVGFTIAVVLFILTSLLPGFGQLFARGGDFLYSPSELLEGAWKVVFHNSALIGRAFITYLNPLVVLSPLLGLVFHDHRRKQAVLFLAVLLFLLPMAVFAEVLHPRYLLPATVLLTLSSALLIDSLVQKLINASIARKVLVAIAAALYCANVLGYAGQWLFVSIADVDQTPLIEEDRYQYLEDWSSGHGIKESVTLLLERSQTQRIAVATEGYFGTLPDGMLLYLHNQNVRNISVDGIGQPVYEIPPWFVQKASGADQRWLIVNSHRLSMNIPKNQLIVQYCRPGKSPCLQVWDITNITPHQAVFDPGYPD